MYIGGSPGSIAGGIKTTTFAIFVATMITIVKNKEEVEVFGRRIPRSQVYKAISVVFLTATWILLTSFILLISEKGFSFIQIFFEVISNFALCGLKTKITASFSTFGKMLIISTMLVGRIGSLTLLLALSKRKKRYLYHYPEEQIVIG
jgi:trk system potassium uptake protein TrkH